MRRAWVALAVAAAVMLEGRPARACTPLPDGIAGRTTLPEDGATGVPRNARVLVQYGPGDELPEVSLQLRVAGGAPVEATVVEVVTMGAGRLLIPAEPLAAATTYEVLDTLVLPCEGYECTGEPAVIATFTTGETLDTVAPQLVGVTTASLSTCPDDDSCPEGEMARVTEIHIEARVDDGPADSVLLEYVSLDGEVLAGPTDTAAIGRSCGGYVPLFIYVPLDATTLEVRAVDLAGNVEAAPPRIANPSCSAICDDDPAGAADAGSDAGLGADDSHGGCGCTAPGDARGAIAVLGLALALLRRRRRRSGHRAGPMMRGDAAAGVEPAAGQEPEARRGDRNGLGRR